MNRLQKEYVAYRDALSSLDNEREGLDGIPARIFELETEAAQACERLRTIQATLSKPWDQYASKRARWSQRDKDQGPQNHTARECWRAHKDMNWKQERADEYRETLANLGTLLATIEQKKNRLQIALDLVQGQLERAGMEVPTGYVNAGVYGERCVQEVCCLEDARAAIVKYWNDAAKELKGMVTR
jgi:hypothetical protein